MARLTAARALTAHIANRFIRLATFIAAGIFLVILIICALLAYYFSGWWWLLLIPVISLFVIFLGIRLIIQFIVRRIHAENLRSDQKKALDDLTDKIERLIEARGTPPVFFVAISIKDLLVHRDITTIKELIKDTATLRRDYETLERLF